MSAALAELGYAFVPGETARSIDFFGLRPADFASVVLAFPSGISNLVVDIQYFGFGTTQVRLKDGTTVVGVDRNTSRIV